MLFYGSFASLVTEWQFLAFTGLLFLSVKGSRRSLWADEDSASAKTLRLDLHADPGRMPPDLPLVSIALLKRRASWRGVVGKGGGSVGEKCSSSTERRNPAARGTRQSITAYP